MMTETDKEAFVGTMVAVAAADDVFDIMKSKTITLNTMMSGTGISEEKFREIINKFITMIVTTGKESMSVFCRDNLGVDYRTKAFHYAVDVAVCKGVLEAPQSQMLDYFASGWGISDSDKNSAIAEAKKKYL